MKRSTSHVSPPDRPDALAAKRSVLDVIHSITGNDRRTGRTVKLLWHLTAAVCAIVVVLGIALSMAAPLPPFALPGLSASGLGVGVFLLYKRWRKRHA